MICKSIVYLSLCCGFLRKLIFLYSFGTQLKKYNSDRDTCSLFNIITSTPPWIFYIFLNVITYVFCAILHLLIFHKYIEIHNPMVMIVASIEISKCLAKYTQYKCF